MRDMFELLDPPDPDLFSRGRDPHDRKMGEVLIAGTEGYGDACFVLVGCPQDEGVRRNAGRPGAAMAPREIRRQLYRLAAPPAVPRGSIIDAGDVRVAGSLEETHERQEKVVSGLLAGGRKVIVLGGGNDISCPDVIALAGHVEGLLAFNIDSHFDVREAPRANSGTPYRQLLETGVIPPASLYQMGHTPGANSPVYHRYLEEKGVPVMSLEDIRREGIDRTFRTILRRHADARAVFWGIDMDAVRSSDAPGVSAGYPVGFSAEEICGIAALAGSEPRTRLFEITECNPRLDVDGRTSKLAAMMIVSLLGSLER